MTPMAQRTGRDPDANGVRAVTEYLRGEGVRFEVIEHAATETAAAESRAVHVPAEEMAKTVVVHDGASCVIAVIPADGRLDLGKLAAVIGAARPVRLATEAEIAAHFPDVAVGAVPPAGPTMVASTVVDQRLLERAGVVCAGGDHRHALRIDPRDIVRLADAWVADLCQETPA